MVVLLVVVGSACDVAGCCREYMRCCCWFLYGVHVVLLLVVVGSTRGGVAGCCREYILWCCWWLL